MKEEKIKLKKIGKIFFYISINILYIINIFEIHGQLNFTSYTDKSKVGLYEQFSLIYSVNEDIKLWAPKVKPGGIISGHDINMLGVRMAVSMHSSQYEEGPDNIWFYKNNG